MGSPPNSLSSLAPSVAFSAAAEDIIWRVGCDCKDMVKATLYFSLIRSLHLPKHGASTGNGGHRAGGVSARQDQSKGLSATLPLVAHVEFRLSRFQSRSSCPDEGHENGGSRRGHCPGTGSLGTDLLSGNTGQWGIE